MLSCYRFDKQCPRSHEVNYKVGVWSIVWIEFMNKHEPFAIRLRSIFKRTLKSAIQLTLSIEIGSYRMNDDYLRQDERVYIMMDRISLSLAKFQEEEKRVVFTHNTGNHIKR